MRRDSEMVNLRSVVEMLCYMVDEDSDGVEEVLQLPTIDLVRCAECKHWNRGRCWGIPFSGDDASYIETEANDFCSYGERKENE